METKKSSVRRKPRGQQASGGKSTRAPAATLNSRDAGIIALMRKDPGISNREIARALGITETTVRNRLRRLESSNAMRLVTMINLAAAGYVLVAAVGVQVKGRAPVDVARDIARFDQVITINLALGDQDLELQVIARDRAELSELLGSIIANVRGVGRLTPSIGLRILKHEVVWVPLTSEPGPRSFQLPKHMPGLKLDELDLGIIEELGKDGRMSNRQIARRLHVNEGTIRARRRRLVEEKIIRIAAVTNVAWLHNPFVAFFWIDVESAFMIETVARALANLPDITFVATMIGRCDVLAITMVERAEDLTRYLHETIDKIPGVHRVHYTLSQEIIKYDPRWCSFTE